MSYPGSKAQAGVFQRIIGQMPPHAVYVEPFFGSGQVFRRKLRSDYSVVADKNPDCLPDDAEIVFRDYELPEILLRKFIAVEGCAFKVLRMFCSDSTDTLIYCDPPYMLSTRKGRVYYKHEMSDVQHVQLLTVLNRLKCRVLISHPPCPLYDRALKDWRCIRYRQMTNGHVLKPDALWCNFPEPEELHDWRFAGGNRRQRWWLNSMRRRWLGKLARLTPRRRGFILNAIRETYPAA